MPQVSIPFRFSQRFKAPAREVYAWATDFDPGDRARMGLAGRRTIEPLCNQTLIFKETTAGAGGRRVTRKKLIRLDPEQMRWTNTHLTGPNRHSQFWYELEPLGRNACRLNYTGLQVLAMRSATAKDLARRAELLTREDSQAWRNLAKAFTTERGQRRGRSRER
jgi:hypothetical protein